MDLMSIVHLFKFNTFCLRVLGYTLGFILKWYGISLQIEDSDLTGIYFFFGYEEISPFYPAFLGKASCSTECISFSF